MGSNFTVEAMQRAVGSVSTLNNLCEKFDSESDVPCVTSAHSTRSDEADVKKVVTVVLKKKILEPNTYMW